MAIGCGATCAKILLICINIIFILSGLVLIAIGIWLIADPDVKELASFIVADDYNLFRSAAILLIAMGAFVLVVSIIGFVGTILEHTIVLTVYIILLVIVFAGECAGGIIAINYKDKVRDRIDQELTKSLLRTLTDESTDRYYIVYNSTDGKQKCKSSDNAGSVWDYIQVEFSCCGVHDGVASGYETSPDPLSKYCPMLKLNGKKPLTCCAPRDENLKPIDTDDQVAHVNDFDCSRVVNQGCADALMQWIEKYAPALIGIGIGIGMFQLIVIIFAVCLCQHVHRKDVE